MSSAGRGVDQGVRWWGMHRALLLLSLLGACHPARPAKAPPPSVPAGPRTLTVTTDIPLAVTVFGPETAKQTVIVVTGGPGLSHHYALPLAQLASDDRRVVFYDQRGTGASGRLPDKAENHTIAHHIDDLDAIRAALKTESVVLIGHSWGSMVVQHYAFVHPEHVASLVVLNGIPSNALAFVQGASRADDRITALVKQGLIPLNRPFSQHDGDCARVAPLLPAYYFDPKHAPGPELAQMTCHETGDATFASIGMYWDNRPHLAELKVPTLVMSGEGDLFGPEWAHDLAAAVRDAKTVILPTCGHLMWDECPAALFGELRAFLK